MHDAPEVSADGRDLRELALLVARAGHALSVELENLALTSAHGARRRGIRFQQPVADEIIRVIEVFFDEFPGSPQELGAVHVENLLPRALPSNDCVAGHHSGQSAECHAVSGKTGRHELSFGDRADVGKSVIGFDHLPRPARIDMGLGNDLFEQTFQSIEALDRIPLLPRLMVLSAQDRIGASLVLFDPQIMIGIRRIPETCFGQGVRRNLRADRVRSIGSQFSLQQRSRDKAGLTLQWHVSGNHDEVALDCFTIRDNAQGPVLNFRDL